MPIYLPTQSADKVVGLCPSAVMIRFHLLPRVTKQTAGFSALHLSCGYTMVSSLHLLGSRVFTNPHRVEQQDSAELRGTNSRCFAKGDERINLDTHYHGMLWADI